MKDRVCLYGNKNSWFPKLFPYILLQDCLLTGRSLVSLPKAKEPLGNLSCRLQSLILHFTEENQTSKLQKLVLGMLGHLAWCHRHCVWQTSPSHHSHKHRWLLRWTVCAVSLVSLLAWASECSVLFRKETYWISSWGKIINVASSPPFLGLKISSWYSRHGNFRIAS